ncbi:MAG TPA: hypothetical protein VMJ64_03530 [Anaerolineales bacterium]|nr:hypothetical protein [Anaerolineales bacterium]
MDRGDPCYWANAQIDDPARPTVLAASGLYMTDEQRWAIIVDYEGIALLSR